MPRPHARPTSRRTQRGATAVEFALIASTFFMLLLGVAEVARVMWVWNAAGEATRLGARLAVVCDPQSTVVKQRMQEALATLGNGNIAVAYEPAGCSATTCQTVTVTLSGYTEQTFVPFVNFAPALPPFRTTLSREYLSSAGNPSCT